MPVSRSATLAPKFVAGCILGACFFVLSPPGFSATNNSATLQWSANLEPDLAGYRIYHGTSPGIYGSTQTVGKTTSYEYPNLTSNTTHYFTITAFDTSGNESLPSSEVSKHIAASSLVELPVSISNLIVASGRSYEVSAFPLQAGGAVYRDRSYTFTTVPASAQGAAYIQTANDDKAATGSHFLSFAVDQPVMVYVAYDSRITSKPVWLSAFTNTGQDLGVSQHGNPFRLFAKAFPAGTITLGGNTGGFSMYSVMVQPQSGSDSSGSGSGSNSPSAPKASTIVLWRNTSNGEVAVWLMNGMTITSVGFPGSTSTDWHIEQIGDMNGDGHTDVLWRNSISGVVAVWLMNGKTIISSGFLGGVPAEWTIQGIGDVNADGKADVFWRNSQNGMVAVWLMNGLTVTSVPFLGSTPLAWVIQKVGDVNGDGKADLVWQHQTSGTVAVWLLNGTAITSVGFPASTSPDWKVQSVGDVNGDGKVDVLWRHKNSGMVAVWLMNGTTMKSYAFLGGVPLAWEIQQVSDMNGDGKADVILQNQTNGMVTVWLMDGVGINSVGFLGSTPANWKMQN
jgi:hypothetical protein